MNHIFYYLCRLNLLKQTYDKKVVTYLSFNDLHIFFVY